MKKTTQKTKKEPVWSGDPSYVTPTEENTVWYSLYVSPLVHCSISFIYNLSQQLSLRNWKALAEHGQQGHSSEHTAPASLWSHFRIDSVAHIPLFQEKNYHQQIRN